MMPKAPLQTCKCTALQERKTEKKTSNSDNLSIFGKEKNDIFLIILWLWNFYLLRQNFSLDDITSCSVRPFHPQPSRTKHKDIVELPQDQLRCGNRAHFWSDFFADALFLFAWRWNCHNKLLAKYENLYSFFFSCDAELHFLHFRLFSPLGDKSKRATF